MCLGIIVFQKNKNHLNQRTTLVTIIGFVNGATFDTHIKLVSINGFLVNFLVYNLSDHHSYEEVKKMFIVLRNI
jgi:hypothetical protein